MNSIDRKKNLARVKALLKKANFIKQVNGANLIIQVILLNWFRQYGHLFFLNDFKIIGNVLYGWNGTIWEEATEYIEKYIFNKIDQLANATIDFRKIPEIVKIAKNKGQFETLATLPWNSDFDEKVFVTFRNGTLAVDLEQKTHQFLLNHFDPAFYAVYFIDCDFKEEFMDNQYWQNSFVGEYLLDFYSDDDRNCLQQFFASVLIPQYQPQQVLVILGEGGDGKGVLMGTLKKLLGKVVTELNVSRWTEKHSTTMLVGSILNITSEAPSREISLDTWKSIVACDYLTIDPKYKTPFSYKPFCKQIMTVNELPKLPPEKASLRRLLITKTCKSTKAVDRSESFRIKFENNLDALVSFILNGLYVLKDNNFREISGSVELRDEFIHQNESTMVDFMQSCIDITDSASDFCSSFDFFLPINCGV
jgi:phage/plasmid-associated DNA primase